MRDRPGDGDGPRDGDDLDRLKQPGRGDEPAGRAPNVADYMRGTTSEGGYDDPIWDLPPDQVEAELARRAKAKAEEIAPRDRTDPKPADARVGEPSLHPADRIGGRIVDDGAGPDSRLERLRVRAYKVADDGLDAVQKSGNAAGHMLNPPDKPSGPIGTMTGTSRTWHPGSSSHIGVGDAAVGLAVFGAVAGEAARLAVRRWRERKDHDDR